MSSGCGNTNVFKLYEELKRLPFAVSRSNWRDTDIAVITKIVPKGEYGTAYAFPVHEGQPNDHFAYHRPWREKMIMPNAGSYQWRHIDLPESEIQTLIETFQNTVAPLFEFCPTESYTLRELDHYE